MIRYGGTSPGFSADDLFAPAGGNAQYLQAAFANQWTSGRALRLGAGTFTLDSAQALGPPPAETTTTLVGIQDQATGEGKTIVVRGANKWLTTLSGAYTADPGISTVLMRWSGEADNRIRLAMSDFTMDVGTTVTTRPAIVIRNADLQLERLIMRGEYDMSSGGGLSITGYVSGVVADIEVYYSVGGGINAASLLETGQLVAEGTHPMWLRYVRCFVYCSTSHAFNIHGNFSGEITDCIAWHDIARFGYPKTNAGLRGGNTGKGVRWIGNHVYGYYRGFQMNDVVNGVVANSIFEQCGGPGGVIGAKNSGEAGNIILPSLTFRGVARLLGRSKPASDAEDADDSATIGSEACGLLISGGESVTVPPMTIESDFRRLGYGTITTTAGNTSVALVDNVNQGSQMGTGLSGNFPGDILYQDDDGDTPSFLGRIAVGGIGSRLYKSGTDGTGDTMETVAYLAEPPDRVNEAYVIWTVTGITAANPAVITFSGTGDIATGKRVWLKGVTDTMSAINGQWLEATKLTATTISVPFDATGLVYGAGGTVQKGAGSATQTITLDGGAMASLAAQPYRLRTLEETTITTGVAKEATSGGTSAIVPLQEPMYFVPGSGNIIVATSGTGVTTSSGSPAFDTTVDPRLDEGAVCVLYGYEGAVTTGTKLTLGVFSSVSSATVAVLTANALRSYTGPWCYSIENKMRYGLIVGDQTDYENRARRVTVDWDGLSVRGALINIAHIYGECIASNNKPTVSVTVPAQTISGPVDVVTIPCVLPRGRQRIWAVTFDFKAAAVTDPTNHVTATVSRLRDGATSEITGMIDVPLTAVARAAGARVTIDGPMPTNDNIDDDYLFKSNERDLVVISLDKAGTGGDIPELIVSVEMLWW